METKSIKRILILLLTIVILFNIISHSNQIEATVDHPSRPSISDMNILFPICKSASIFDCKDVYFKLKGHNGCFDWNLEESSFVRIKKIPSTKLSNNQTNSLECFNSVIVSTNINSDPKAYVYLHSVDKLTNHKFKTKIGFGVISKLSVFKRFAYMNVGENLELGVIGKDANNNSFSSLEGYVFNWKVIDKNEYIKENDNRNFNTAELIKLSSEDKDISEYREKAEKTMFCDLILLNGILTGKVEVYAELLDNGYQVKSNNKEVIIKEDFELNPSEVWMTTLTDFTFEVNVELGREVDVQDMLGSKIANSIKPIIKKERVDPAKFKFFNFKLTESSCGRITTNKEIIFSSNNDYCQTLLQVSDIRLPEHNNGEAIIHVVKPELLDLGIQELSQESLDLLINNKEVKDDLVFNFLDKAGFLNNDKYNFNKRTSLLTDKYYLIKNFLKTNEKYLIFNETKLNFTVDLESLINNNKVELIKTYFNSNLLLVKAKQTTTDYHTIVSSIKQPIETSVLKNIMIYDRISIHKFGMKRFFLPFSLQASQELRLTVKGGSGLVKYSSSNKNVIEIRDGILYAKEKGVSVITVSDSSLENNYDTIEVEVRDIDNLINVYNQKQDVKINEEGVASISAIHDSDYYHEANNNDLNIGLFIFTNCTSLNIENEYESDSITNANLVNDNSYANIKAYLSSIKDKHSIISKRLLEISEIYNNNVDYSIRNNISKLDFKSKEYLNLKNNYLSEEYLEYANYGICGLARVKSSNSGFISISKSKIILNNSNSYGINRDVNINFVSILKPEIQFYSKLIQVSPSTNDLHNLKMLKTNTYDKPFIQNPIIISPYSKIDLEFTKGIKSWNNKDSNAESKYNNNSKKNDDSFKFEVSYYETNNSSSEKQLKKISYSDLSSYFKLETKENKNISIECYYELKRDVIISIKTYNLPSDFLLNPKSSETSFLFSCSFPSYYSINLEDDYDRNEVLSIPQNNKLVYTRQINSLANIRIYAFDNEKRIFIKHDGVKGSLNSNKNFDEILLDNNNKLDLYYIKKQILVKNDIIQFPVEYVSNKNLSHSILINAVNQAYLTPKEVKLYLHNENFYEFEIINGSGNFILELSDLDIGAIEYFPDTNNRKFKFYPKQLGVTEVLLKDKNFSMNEVISKSMIIVADISRIQFFAPFYLMIGNEIDALVKVYDKKGLPFSEQQIEKMNLIVKKSSYESQGLSYFEDDSIKNNYNYNESLVSSNNKVLVLSSKITSKIKLQGAFEGIQSLSVLSNNNIESNTIQIQVFDNVEVFPPVLLLYPGSEFTLKILGGPENEKSLNKIFSISDSSIADISKTSPRVKAAKIGITEINISFVYKADENQLYSTDDERDYYNSIKEYKLCEVKVPLQVAFPERVEIENANNRKLYSNSAVRFLASLKLGDRSFTYGIGNIEFNWTVDNPHLAKFNTKTINNASSCDSNSPSTNNYGNEHNNSLDQYSQVVINEYNLGLSTISTEVGAFLVAYNYGNVTIKLTTKINYPAPYESHRPNLFTTKKTISIEENVWVDIAEFYDKNPGKSSLYLIPYNIGHYLKTHKKDQEVNYKILKKSSAENENKIISLNKSGRIETYENSGLVNILIEKTERSGLTIPTVLNVFVTNYHSIFAQRSYEIILMEAGKMKDLTLTIQHESGLLFAEGFENLGLTVVESNPKVAKAEIINNSSQIRISAYKPGETYIIIYIRASRKILDVFKVGVESSLSLPSEINLLLGSVMSLFKNDARKLSYIENLDAQWVTNDNSIIEIKNNSQIVALKEGSTKLTLESSNGRSVILSTIVNVSALNSIKLELANVPSYITDKEGHKNYEKEYSFNFRYQMTNSLFTNKYINDTNLDKDFSSHEISNNIITKCSVDPEYSDLIAADTISTKDHNNKDKETNKLNPSYSNKCVIKVFSQKSNSSLLERIIKLKLNASLRTSAGTFNKENTINITYHPGFITKTKIISFSEDDKTFKLVIANPHSKNELLIENSTPQLLRITKSDDDYLVTVPSDIEDEFESTITITDRTINEVQTVKVEFLKIEHSNFFFWLIFIVLVVLLVISGFLFIIGGEEEKKNNIKQNHGGFTYSDINKNRSNQGRLFETNKSY